MLHVVFFQFNHRQSLAIILINARWLTSSTQMLPKISYWSTQLLSGKEDHSALISNVKYFLKKKHLQHANYTSRAATEEHARWTETEMCSVHAQRLT